MHFQKSLPRLEIPKLEDTIERYMTSQKPLLSSEEFETTDKIAKDFLKGDGLRRFILLIIFYIVMLTNCSTKLEIFKKIF